jgi:hypothetical protein
MSPGGGKISIYSTDTNARYNVSIRGNLGEIDQTEVIRASGTSPVYSRYSYDHIGSLGKDDTTFDLLVEDQSGGNLLTLSANESSRLHQRISFHSTPSNSGALAVLYKRRCRDLILDSDAVEIHGDKIDDMLIAGAIGDMREGERQYGKAALKSQEVMGLMNMAISMEKEQGANNCRIIPELLHSPDWSGACLYDATDDALSQDVVQSFQAARTIYPGLALAAGTGRLQRHPESMANYEAWG